MEIMASKEENIVECKKFYISCECQVVTGKVCTKS